MTSVSPELMSEDELLRRAHRAMARAARLPVGSLGRAVQWAVFESYAGELERWAIRFVVSLGEPPER